MQNFSMVAPQSNSGSGKNKNPNAVLVPMGSNPAIIIGLVNIGTQSGEYNGKPYSQDKLKMIVEFPFHRQKYYVEDENETPSNLIIDCTYRVNKYKGKKSKLLEIIESIVGPIPEAQYSQFNLMSILGMKVFANVTHYTKLDGSVGAKITSFSPLNPAYVNPDSMVQEGKTLCYSVQMGFENEVFAGLPNYLRNLIKESFEGKEFASKGGRFTKLDENGNLIFDVQENNMAPAPATNSLIMINTQYTYDEMKRAGWSDDALIEHGYAKRSAPAMAPQMPPQQAPMPTPQAYSVPSPQASAVNNFMNNDPAPVQQPNAQFQQAGGFTPQPMAQQPVPQAMAPQPVANQPMAPQPMAGQPMAPQPMPSVPQAIPMANVPTPFSGQAELDEVPF